MTEEETITENNSIRIRIMPVIQPIGTFYVGVANAKDVVAICSADERRLDLDKLEAYIGVQRPLNPKRVREIKEYVKTWDASFPNSVILAINAHYYRLTDDDSYMLIKKTKAAANIIDGQHRLAGFDEGYEGDFQIILALFPELEYEEQAYLFSVINTKMTRINPSLEQDLLDFSTIDTPNKLAHNIAKTFNQDKSNPWYGKIKLLGRRERNSDAVLSQSRFTKEIVNLMCYEEDMYQIRDILRKNKNNRSSLATFYKDSSLENFIFWEAFIQSNDKFIYTVLKDYFLAVRDIYSAEWDDVHSILTKTTGYSALVAVLTKLIPIGTNKGLLTREFFREYFEKAKTSNVVSPLSSKHYPPGETGERDLANDLLVGMGLKQSNQRV